MPDEDAVQECMDSIQSRLRRIEGQTRGLQKMVEEGRPCGEIVTQVSAAMGATRRISAIVVACSMRQAVQAGVGQGPKVEKELGKLVEAFAKMA